MLFIEYRYTSQLITVFGEVNDIIREQNMRHNNDINKDERSEMVGNKFNSPRDNRSNSVSL